MPTLSRLFTAPRLFMTFCAAALIVAVIPATPSSATHKRGAAHLIINEVLRSQERKRKRRIYVAPTVRISRAQIAEAQRILNLIGYDAGSIDGAMGRRTRTALVYFQRDSGLRQTGAANDQTLVSLRRAEATWISRAQPVQPAQPEQPTYQTASADSGDVSGLYCAGSHSMALNEIDGGDLQFMVSSAQSGHLCAAEGTARRTPYGWRYEANMRGEATERCAIEISADGAVRLSTDADARCQSLCGARATLNGIAFPSAARVTAIPAARLFENDGALFQESCGS
jgi:peptidoglycan hydrolase-like protein with peptidoglycan-binding domain